MKCATVRLSQTRPAPVKHGGGSRTSGLHWSSIVCGEKTINRTETRSPKPEIRRKSEGRNPKSPYSQGATRPPRRVSFRPSDFEFPSGFGFRVSGLTKALAVIGSLEVALLALCGSLVGALGTHWGGLRVAISWLSTRIGVALMSHEVASPGSAGMRDFHAFVARW
jgi:hypothetical protein